MKKLIVFILSALCATSLIVPAFAEEVPEAVPGYDVPVVSLSPDSIAAIAEAVTTTYTAQVTNKEGMIFDVPGIMEQHWSNYPYIVRVIDVSGKVNWLMSKEPAKLLIFDEEEKYLDITGENSRIVLVSQMGSSWSANANVPIGSTKAVANITWSNYDILNYDTNELVYASDVETAPPVYTISFVTGFDDVTCDPVTTDDIKLPAPKKDGYVFLGWFKDSALTEPFIAFDGDSDITLYAKWSEELPMSFFTGTIFGSLTTLFECQPVLYLMSLMALCVIVGILKDFFVSRT